MKKLDQLEEKLLLEFKGRQFVTFSDSELDQDDFNIACISLKEKGLLIEVHEEEGGKCIVASISNKGELKLYEILN